MPRSEKALAAIAKTKAEPRLKPATVAPSLSQARAAIRDAVLALTELRFDLADVEDADDRRTATEELNQKVGGGIREGSKALDQLDAFVRVLSEIERETPRIEAQITTPE